MRRSHRACRSIRALFLVILLAPWTASAWDRYLEPHSPRQERVPTTDAAEGRQIHAVANLHINLGPEVKQTAAGTDVEAFFKEPGVQRCLDSLTRLIVETIGVNLELESRAESERLLSGLNALFRSEIQLRVGFVTDAGMPGPVPVVQALVAGVESERFAGVLQTLHARTSERIAAHSQPGWAVQGYLLGENTHLWIASSPGYAGFTLGPDFMPPPRFAERPAWRLPADNTRVVGLQVDIRGLIAAISDKQQSGHRDPVSPFEAMLTLLGIGHWERVDLALTFQHDGLLWKGGIATDGMPGALLELLAVDPIAQPMPELRSVTLPVSHVRINVAPTEMLRRWRALVKSIPDGRLYGIFENALQALGRDLEMDVEVDVVAALKAPVEISVHDVPQANSLVLRYAAPLAERRRFSDTMVNLWATLEPLMSDDEEIQTSVWRDGTQSVWSISRNDQIPNTFGEIRWGRDGNSAFLALLRAMPEGAVPTHDAFAGSHPVKLLDATDATCQWYHNLETQWRLLDVQVRERITAYPSLSGLSIADLPDVEAVTRYLGAARGWLHVTDDGLYWEHAITFASRERAQAMEE